MMLDEMPKNLLDAYMLGVGDGIMYNVARKLWRDPAHVCPDIHCCLDCADCALPF